MLATCSRSHKLRKQGVLLPILLARSKLSQWPGAKFLSHTVEVSSLLPRSGHLLSELGHKGDLIHGPVNRYLLISPTGSTLLPVHN